MSSITVDVHVKNQKSRNNYIAKIPTDLNSTGLKEYVTDESRKIREKKMVSDLQSWWDKT